MLSLHSYGVSVTIRGVVIYLWENFRNGWTRTTKLRQVHVEYRKEKAKEEVLIFVHCKNSPTGSRERIPFLCHRTRIANLISIWLFKVSLQGSGSKLINWQSINYKKWRTFHHRNIVGSPKFRRCHCIGNVHAPTRSDRNVAGCHVSMCVEHA